MTLKNVKRLMLSRTVQCMKRRLNSQKLVCEKTRKLVVPHGREERVTVGLYREKSRKNPPSNSRFSQISLYRISRLGEKTEWSTSLSATPPPRERSRACRDRAAAGLHAERRRKPAAALPLPRGAGARRLPACSVADAATASRGGGDAERAALGALIRLKVCTLVDAARGAASSRA